MKIGLVGWGLESKSAFRHFGPEHEYLIVNESLQDDFPNASEKIKVQYLPLTPPVGIAGQVQDLSYLKGIEHCDKIVYQPTAYFNLRKFFGNDDNFWAKATTAYDIFFQESPTKNIIGVTGTKGKGTTSTLIAKMLEADGQPVHLGGNIGTPILDMLPEIKPNDWLVWELANFQLNSASYSPHIGVCLMIVPEHLDWHANMAEYVAAKSNLFAHQTEQDIAVYFPENKYSVEAASHTKGTKIPYYKMPGARIRDDGMIVVADPEVEIMNKNDVKLLGEHNLQNICAAVTAFWQVSQNAESVRQVLTSFSGLEHRLEFVRELKGVKYYDDSFGTTPETAIVAMQSFAEPKVMILGGSDKGIPFDSLADAVINSNVRHAIVIGNTGPQISRLLKDRGFKNITEGLATMTEIVKAASAQAQRGDVVLLSAGCASFGLFKDYKDRGNQFKAAVNKLT